MHYTFHWNQAARAIPEMLGGVIVTLEGAVLSMVLGIGLGLLLALARNSRNKIIFGVSTAWVELARNTPALYQIYVAYFGLATLGIHLDSFPALVAGISFSNAGYLAETFRGGLRAVPSTQTRAARSLGMTAPTAFTFVVLPQLMRHVFYPVTNQMVWSVLLTSLGVVVGLSTDLMGITQQLSVISFRTFEYFIIAAVLYYAIVKVLMIMAALLARRLFVW
ncbi:MAG TPA: amino acid ABC transporter permease [Rhizobiaceae bacterium]|jgi:polar amino acid transport system permease protein|nr:amino acid ABC transporter permease [Rhizobiaceae bacterium]